ncbi:MAG: hypothetical protein GF344_16155 [Chitinivibrionales bacterium]|nr:hypothetical protein [Chitinivibrionales bacterium]MBD3358227.1 hypothetical protein [Chitinivibrionales bacterium]
MERLKSAQITNTGKFVLVLGILVFTAPARSGGVEYVSLGINVMLGVRYDDLRMCVATPAGVKGGPVADIMLDTRLHFTEDLSLCFKLPVMRPILFGLKFDMLQFEPEIIVEYRSRINDNVDLVLGPGIGLSLHYGPDYTTPDDAADPERFFAAGPIISGLAGIGFRGSSGREHIIGVRPFYTPLFSDARPTGTVLGAAIEGHIGLSD